MTDGWVTAMVSAAAGVAALAGLGAGSPTLVVVPPLGMLAWWHRSARVAPRQRDERLAGGVPAFVDDLIQQLKAGHSLAQAARRAAAARTAASGGEAVGEALAPLRATLDAGAGLEVALARIRPDVDRDLALVVDTLSVLVHRGGPAVPSLERLSDTLRSAQWVEQEVRAQAAQAIASATVLAALPAVFVVGLGALDHRMAIFYLFDPLRAGCLVVAAALSYGAWWWIDATVGRQR